MNNFEFFFCFRKKDTRHKTDKKYRERDWSACFLCSFSPLHLLRVSLTVSLTDVQHSHGGRRYNQLKVDFCLPLLLPWAKITEKYIFFYIFSQCHREKKNIS